MSLVEIETSVSSRQHKLVKQKYSRFTAPIKKSSYPVRTNDIAVIIPAAASSRRMKALGSRSILPLSNGKLVIEHQVETIKTVFSESEITLIGGIDIDKVIPKVPLDVKLIINDRYEETTAVYSVLLALLATTKKSVLIVSGDLIFNKELLSGVNESESCLFVDSKGHIDDGEVGVVCQDNFVTHLTYGVHPKWSQIIYLTGNELALLRNLIVPSVSHRLFLFEIINQIMENGGKFNIFENKDGVVKEIDTHKQLKSIIKP